MATTEVLRPQDLLTPTTSFRRLNTLTSTGILAMKQHHQGKPYPKNDKKRSKASPPGKKSTVADRHRKGGAEITTAGLTMGQVTLLKRGESLSSIASEIPKPSPTQKVAPKNNRFVAASAPPADTFAGSCISPPSPRALPVPTFFSKSVVSNSVEDGATMFLRRVLRLE